MRFLRPFLHRLHNNIKTKRLFMIFGNGFDIECDLSTSYPYFFNEIFGVNVVSDIEYLYGAVFNYKYDEKTRKNIYQKNVEELRKQVLKSLTSHNCDKVNELKTAINKVRGDFLKKYNKKIDRLIKYKENIIQNLSHGKVNLVKVFNLIDQVTHDLHSLQYREQWLNNNWVILFIVSSVVFKKDKSHSWSDVEEMLARILKVIFYPKNKFDNDNKESNLFVDDHNNPIIQEKYQKMYLKIIRLLFDSGKSNFDILFELEDFEGIFSKFIQIKIFESNKEPDQLYYKNAYQLIKYLSGIKNMPLRESKIIIDVLNFNYSLDPEYIYYLQRNKLFSVNSWVNIHGIENCKNRKEKHIKKDQIFNPPIFGISDRGIQKNDPRYIFTKKSRLKCYGVNLEQIFQNFQPKIDSIIIYGHSLNAMDSSYFVKLFKKYNLLNSRITLKILFTNNQDRDKKEKKLDKILRSYREDIEVKNLLETEKRLQFIQVPSNQELGITRRKKTADQLLLLKPNLKSKRSSC